MDGVPTVFIIAGDSPHGPEPESAIEAHSIFVCRPHHQLYPLNSSLFEHGESVLHQPRPDPHFLAPRVNSNRNNFRFRFVHTRHHIAHDPPRAHSDEEQAATVAEEFAEHCLGVRTLGKRRALEAQHPFQIAGAERPDFDTAPLRRHGPIVPGGLAAVPPAPFARNISQPAWLVLL